MTDTDTNVVSLALYRYLCQNIVGTENYVKTIRLLNNVRDNVMSTNHQTDITSGSYGEGLEMRGSDLDRMTVSKSIEINEDTKKLYNPNITYYRMETDDVKPGYTQLILENNYVKPVSEYCEERNGNYYFSSGLLKQHLLNKSNVDTFMIHGPCISDKDGRCDNAVSLHCKTWISQASQWISRSNSSWPSYSVKQSIIKYGVLFVPIGVKGSSTEDIEWRISFSVGEQLLISTFTHTQLLCYVLLKILLKDVIATYTECSDLLCSYFVKTIIFWISEELPQSVWKPNNLIPCFMRCFSRLIYCVKYSACVHYFIPENNMFENKIDGHAREILLDKLYYLHSYGWRCVLFSDQLSDFHVSMWMDHFDSHALHTSEVAFTLHSNLLFINNCIKDVALCMETNEYKRIIHQIVICDQSSLQYLYTYYMSLWCARYAQTFPLNSTLISNKHQYREYNSCFSILFQGLHHDTVSGWLMIASFFYKSKQYSNALLIIQYSLSKCTPDKLTRFMDIHNVHDRLLTLKYFQKKIIVRLWKIMLVDFMKFYKNSSLVPNELEIVLEHRELIISSIVYAYFLKILCYHHLNNVRLRQDCLDTLQLVIADNYCMEGDTQIKYEAYNVLGIALQLSGDHEAAQQAFMQSVEIPHYRDSNDKQRLLSMSPL